MPFADDDLDVEFDVLPPAEVAEIFNTQIGSEFPLLTWPMFCMMTTTERMDLHQYCHSSMSQILDLEVAISKDSRRKGFQRDPFSTKIKNVFNQIDLKKQSDQEDQGADLTDFASQQRTNPLAPLSSQRGGSSSAQNTVPTVRIADNFVGIRNQSSTCYLNALIQALFHLPCFRQLIYKIPVTTETKPTESIPLALQLLFFALQQRRASARTVNLTSAFGWDSAESAIQHDIHELTRKLLDELEAETSNTPLAEAIQKMFCGKMLYYTKCLDVDYISRRMENFYDVEVVVRGNASLEASLDTLVKPERMEDGNKYLWEHEDQIDPTTKKPVKTYHDADRGVAFQQLPPVLMVHPNRLEFDMNTFQRVTVNDKWEFPMEIDMSPYVADDTGFVRGAVPAPAASAGDDDPNASGMGRQQSSRILEDYRYVLRSVVVHSGYATAGHYYCYVNFDGLWLKFNDDIVTDVTVDTMLNDAVGGEYSTTNYWGDRVTRSSNTRASLLVYVRKSLADQVIFDIKEEDIPPHILERTVEEAAKEAQSGSGNSKDLHAANIIQLPDHSAETISTVLKQLRDYNTAPLWTFDPKKTVFEQFDFAGKDVWLLGSWFTYSHTYRHTYKARRVKREELIATTLLAGYPDVLLVLPPEETENASDAPPAAAAAVSTTTATTSSNLAIDEDPMNSTTPMLLFVWSSAGTGDFAFEGLARSPKDFKSKFMPEGKRVGLVMEWKRTVTSVAFTELRSGDIVIVFDEAIETAAQVRKNWSLKHFSVSIEVFNLLEPADPVININCIEETTYTELQDMIHEQLGRPDNFGPEHIGLRNHNLTADAPSRHMLLAERKESGVKRTVTLNDLLSYKASVTVNKLHYEVIPLGLTAVEVGDKGYHDFTVYDGNKPKHVYWAPGPTDNYMRDDQIAELLITVSTALDIPRHRLRLFSYTYDGRLEQSSLHLRDDRGFSLLWREIDIIVDVLPEDVATDPQPESESMVLDVQHVCRRNGEEYFHSPTVIRLRPDDTAADVIRRVATHMTLSEVDSKSWKLYFRPSISLSGQPIPIELTAKVWDVVVAKKLTNRCYLLIDHPTMTVAPSIKNLKYSAGKWNRTAEPELRIRSHRTTANPGTDASRTAPN